MNAMTAPDELSFDPETRNPRDYARVARAIAFLLDRRDEQPALDAVAAAAGLSPFHFQRLFKRWAGVSPKQFMGYLTVAHAKEALARSASLLDTAFESGLSGPSRLHDMFVAFEAMTPGEYKARGADLVIRHGVHDTPFGRALIMTTARGVCGVQFVDDGNVAQVLAAEKARWPLSRFVADDAATAAVAARMFAPLGDDDDDLRLLLKGTNFQIQVWTAILRLPPGAVASYADVARAVGNSKAVRAVGTALGRNAVAYLVPCHRVLRSTGLFGGYRWSPPRRAAMLGWEAARAADAAA